MKEKREIKNRQQKEESNYFSQQLQHIDLLEAKEREWKEKQRKKVQEEKQSRDVQLQNEQMKK